MIFTPLIPNANFIVPHSFRFENGPFSEPLILYRNFKVNHSNLLRFILTNMGHQTPLPTDVPLVPQAEHASMDDARVIESKDKHTWIICEL